MNATRKRVTVQAPECLRFAGILGHRYAVTSTAMDGTEKVSGETDSLPMAKEWASKDALAVHRIWERTWEKVKPGWRLVE